MNSIVNNLTPNNKSECDRINLIHEYNILDTPLEDVFDRITALAARLNATPICTISLVDERRIWFKSHHGLEVSEIERSSGLCASAILVDDYYVVEDASLHPLAKDNTLVTSDFGLRFYAAVPLKAKEGINIGVISIADFKPRTISDREIDDLKTFALIVMQLIELHKSAGKIQSLNAQLSAHNQSLLIEATRDELTGLLNKSAIMAKLSQLHKLSQSEQHPLGLIVADIDNFKKINDTYGHAAGDLILIEVAKRMRHAARKTDYIGRIGGEEFLLPMCPCNSKELGDVAQRILHIISDKPFMIDNHQSINVTISLGTLSHQETKSISTEQLFKLTDDALYVAKRNGRNQIAIA